MLENPLSFATSRIVTIDELTWEWRTNKILTAFRPLEFTRGLADTTAESETSVKRSTRIGGFGEAVAGLHVRRFIVPNPVAASGGDAATLRAGGSVWRDGRSCAHFSFGQEALNENRLAEAERDFRQVLAANPEVGGAYANLGVVYMRRRQWSKALDALRQAEHLMPQVAGIRLNIGLAYFRQNEFLKAIPLF